jgi:hypothetical protein
LLLWFHNNGWFQADFHLYISAALTHLKNVSQYLHFGTLVLQFIYWVVMDHRSNGIIMIWHMKPVCCFFKNHNCFMLQFAILKVGVELYFQKILVSTLSGFVCQWKIRDYMLFMFSLLNVASDSYLYCIQFCRQTSNSACFLISLQFPPI